MIGKKIANFQVLEELGSGGMGTVYKARDINLKRFVAIKVLNNHLLKNDNNYKRFRNEAEVSAQINHPNVATLLNYLEVDDRSYIVMEFVDGITLEDLLNDKESLTKKESLEITVQVLKGLGAAHNKGILHRDLKPANIMISKHGYVKIMDFGIALMENATRLTTQNKVIGTINYMSPELLKGELPSTSSDLYAVGVMLYEMLSGELLFMAESEASLMYKIVHDKPKMVLRKNKKSLEGTLAKMVNKNPNRRYTETTELLNALAHSDDVSVQRKKIAIPDLKSIYDRVNKRIPAGIFESVNQRFLLICIAISVLIILIISTQLKNDDTSSYLSETGEEAEENDPELRSYNPTYKSTLGVSPPLDETYDDLVYNKVSEIITETKDEPEKRISKEVSREEEPPPIVKSEPKKHTREPVEKLTSQPLEEEAKTPVNQQPREQEVSDVSNEEIPETRNPESEPEPKPEPKVETQIFLRQQKISLTFSQDISSNDYEEGNRITLVTAESITAKGITIIEEGASVRAIVVHKKESNNGKIKFGIQFLDVQAVNGEWLTLKYPEYTDIQKNQVLFEKGRVVRRVTLTSKKLKILI